MNNQHGHLQREHFVNGLSEFKGPGLSRGILIGRNSRMAVDSKEYIYVSGYGLFRILPSGAVSQHYTKIPGGLEALSIDREDNIYLSQYHSQEYRSPSGGSEYSMFPFLQPSPETSYFDIYKLSAHEEIRKVLKKQKEDKFFHMAIDSSGAIYTGSYRNLKKIVTKKLFNKSQIIVDHDPRELDRFFQGGKKNPILQ